MKTSVGQPLSAVGSLVTFLAVLALLNVVSCGSDGPQEGENYGNLLNSPQGLVLVQEEHPTGWTRPECFACHEPRNIHTVNRTGLPDCSGAPQEACVDLPGIRTIVGDGGQASCVLCHGDNGVRP